MTLFQHLELFAIDIIGLALVAATIYSIIKLPWSNNETEKVWSAMVFRLHRFFNLPTHQTVMKPSPPTLRASNRRWIPIKVVQSC